MTEDVIEAAYRHEFGRALATVARLVGDLDLAEESVQEAFADALRTWPGRGTPVNPGAWITTAARNRAVDVLRREAVRTGREAEAARLGALREEVVEVTPVPDDQLRMAFTCCHPALSRESQVALTLRLVCGLTTSEIARAFLQPEHTVAQRISRAKGKIRQAGIPLRVPPEHLLPERTPQVLACVYLVFSEGYFATSGPSAIRDELCAEAIRLGRLLCGLMPRDGETRALLALMLLHDSRRGQRRSPDRGLVPLEEQDRSRWDRATIREGLTSLVAAAELGGGAYLAQARIAAAHAVAPSWQRTDWGAIVRAYDDLAGLSPSPAVLVNRAVAVGFRDGFDAGLASLDAIADHPRLAGSPTVPTARADHLRQAGRLAEALEEYHRAISLTRNDQARAFLLRRIAELDAAL